MSSALVWRPSARGRPRWEVVAVGLVLLGLLLAGVGLAQGVIDSAGSATAGAPALELLAESMTPWARPTPASKSPSRTRPTATTSQRGRPPALGRQTSVLLTLGGPLGGHELSRLDAVADE